MNFSHERARKLYDELADPPPPESGFAAKARKLLAGSEGKHRQAVFDVLASQASEEELAPLVGVLHEVQGAERRATEEAIVAQFTAAED